MRKRVYRNSSGLQAFVDRVADRLIDRAIKRRRRTLAAHFEQSFGCVVKYGPFAGLRLSPDSWWGRSDRAGMLLGFYEREVLETLATKPEGFRTLIDIGAADGYYAIGGLVSGLFDKAECFESSEQGRRVIEQSAAINGVSDAIRIHGVAARDFYKSVDPQMLKGSVVLSDIEGGEFDIFDEEALFALRECMIVIELHEFMRGQKGVDELEDLKRRASNWFDVRLLSTAARDLSGYPELEHMTDSDRWLMCSESRPRLMSWLALRPKAG
ncbi:MAG: hypothetical protein ACK4MV_09140 [Beijerinckiaceae bacterium]